MSVNISITHSVKFLLDFLRVEHVNGWTLKFNQNEAHFSYIYDDDFDAPAEFPSRKSSDGVVLEYMRVYLSICGVLQTSHSPKETTKKKPAAMNFNTYDHIITILDSPP